MPIARSPVPCGVGRPAVGHIHVHHGALAKWAGDREEHHPDEREADPHPGPSGGLLQNEAGDDLEHAERGRHCQPAERAARQGGSGEMQRAGACFRQINVSQIGGWQRPDWR